MRRRAGQGAAGAVTGRMVRVLARIGRFEVERTLGSGSFATVWLARDEDLEAWVAIKLLAENWSYHQDARRRFLQEARALRKLDDDRIVRVYEVGRLPDDRPYMVMEYADRGSLEERMRLRAQLDQPYSVREAVVLSVALADCLASVHASRIVHRDVKPSNVLFKSVRTPRRDAEGRIVGTVSGERTLLGDFGIARSLEGVLGPTRIVGSPQYMAPEQADPELAGHVDERADIYSAAVILYELLAGRPPHPVPGSGPEETGREGIGREGLDGDDGGPEGRRASGREPPAIGGLRRDVPDALAEVIHRALARDRRERFATAEGWRQALVRSLDADGGRLSGVVVDDDPPLFGRAVAPPPAPAPNVPTLPVPPDPTLPTGPAPGPEPAGPEPAWPVRRPEPARAAETAAAGTERRTLVMEDDDVAAHPPASGGPGPREFREAGVAAASRPAAPAPSAPARAFPEPDPAPALEAAGTAPIARPAPPAATIPPPRAVPPAAGVEVPAAGPFGVPGAGPVGVPAAGSVLDAVFRRARLAGAITVLAGAGALAAAFVPFGSDRAGAGLETRLASTSLTLAQAAALGGLCLVLAGWAVRRTYQRWLGRLLAMLVWVVGAAALGSGGAAGLASGLDASRGPVLAPFVLSASGLVAILAAHLALRRFRRPAPSIPPAPPAYPVRPA